MSTGLLQKTIGFKNAIPLHKFILGLLFTAELWLFYMQEQKAPCYAKASYALLLAPLLVSLYTLQIE